MEIRPINGEPNYRDDRELVLSPDERRALWDALSNYIRNEGMQAASLSDKNITGQLLAYLEEPAYSETKIEATRNGMNFLRNIMLKYCEGIAHQAEITKSPDGNKGERLCALLTLARIALGMCAMLALETGAEMTDAERNEAMRGVENVDETPAWVDDVIAKISEGI